MAKRIVKPLNEMSLDNAEKIETYPELAPLTDKLKSQQNQLREQEKELRRRRDEFDAATGSMTEGLVLLNEQGSVLSINKAATKALDIGRYCIGKDIRALSEEPRLRETVEKALGGEHGEAHITLGGVIIRTAVSDIRVCGRSSQGVIVMRTSENGKVISLARTDPEQEDETETEDDE